MKRALQRLGLLLALVTPGGLACGGGGGGGEAAAPAAAGEGAAKKKPAAVAAGDGTEVVTIPIKNPKWDLLKRHFLKYRGQKHAPPKNVFESMVTRLIERPVIQEAAAEPEVQPDVDIAPPEERGPLQQHAAKDYQVLLIQSGTAVPKAVVLDPRDNAYVVTVDTKIGDKGGVIEAITQYMIVIKEPDGPVPLKLLIRPPFLDLAGQQGFEGTEYKPPAGFEPPAAHLPAPKVPDKTIKTLKNLPGSP